MSWALPTFDSLSPTITIHQHFTNIPLHHPHLPSIFRTAWLVCSFHQYLLFLFLCVLASGKRQQKLHHFSPGVGGLSVHLLFLHFCFYFLKSTFYFCLILSSLILSKSENTPQSSSQVVGKSTLEMPSGITFCMFLFHPLSGSLTQTLENKLECTSLLPEFNYYR